MGNQVTSLQTCCCGEREEKSEDTRSNKPLKIEKSKEKNADSKELTAIPESPDNDVTDSRR